MGKYFRPGLIFGDSTSPHSALHWYGGILKYRRVKFTDLSLVLIVKTSVHSAISFSEAHLCFRVAVAHIDEDAAIKVFARFS